MEIPNPSFQPVEQAKYLNCRQRALITCTIFAAICYIIFGWLPDVAAACSSMRPSTLQCFLMQATKFSPQFGKQKAPLRNHKPRGFHNPGPEFLNWWIPKESRAKVFRRKSRIPLGFTFGVKRNMWQSGQKQILQTTKHLGKKMLFNLLSLYFGGVRSPDIHSF